VTFAVLISLASYLLLVTAVLAVAALAPVRRWVIDQTLRGAGRGRRAGRRAGGALRGLRRALHARPLLAGRNIVAGWGRLQWIVVGGALLVLLGPAGIVMCLGAAQVLEPYRDEAQPAESHIAALLSGEQLVPPAALPPEVFSSADVMQLHPFIADASREWSALDDDFRQRLLLLFKRMHDEHGYDMALLEGYRSPERQAMLFARGPKVTRASANQSYHQFGLAADCAFVRGGRLVVSEKDPWAMRGYAIYGPLAQSLGLEWGGRWRGIADFGHVELHRAGVGLDAANAAR